MPVSPTPIAALPTPPSRDDSATFSDRADAFLGALPTFRSETNAIGTNVYNNAVEVDINASTVASNTTLAVNSANAAAGSAGAARWVSGTTYALGAVVWSPANGQIYRRIIAGSGTTDPSADGTNWTNVYGFTFSGNNASLAGNLTLSAGTANGVLYLNASKVATSGSALTFDGATFTNSGNSTGTIFNTIVNTDAAGSSITDERIVFAMGGSLGFGITGWANAGIIEAASTGGLYLGAFNGSINFSTGLSGRQINMSLDPSGNLGIGTASPGGKLHVSNGANTDSGNFTGLIIGGTDATNARTASLIKNTSSPYDLIIRSQNATSTTTGDLIFQNGSTEQMRLKDTGNLGLGVTPSAWNSYKALQITGGGSFVSFGNAAEIWSNAFYDGTNNKYLANGFATRYHSNNSGAHQWYTAPSGTAGNAITFTQAMTLDASGNLLVGTTTAAWAAAGRGLVEINGSSTFMFGGKVGGTQTAYFAGSSGGAEVATITSIPLIFTTNNTERARITAGGYWKASNDGTYQDSTSNYHEFRSTNNTYAVYITNTNASPLGTVIEYNNASPNGTGNVFLYCSDSTAVRATIRSNGGLANYQSNNVDLSDARTKKDIAPAASMWGKIGALEIVTYKYNDQTHDDVNVGVIAQQVESVEPVWVDADGFGETPEGEEPLKTVYTKDITFAAIKALQEAMTRIEQLEAKVAALESK